MSSESVERLDVSAESAYQHFKGKAVEIGQSGAKYVASKIHITLIVASFVGIVWNVGPDLLISVIIFCGAMMTSSNPSPPIDTI